jgi:hypothetical protein
VFGHFEVFLTTKASGCGFWLSCKFRRLVWPFGSDFLALQKVAQPHI